MQDLDSLRAAEATIDLYCTAWSCADVQERMDLLRASMADNGRYCDPGTASVLAIDELNAHIAGVIERRPGARVVRTSQLDLHHRHGRFAWCVLLPDGSRQKEESEDFVQFDVDGRLLLVVGFFGATQRL